MIKKTIIKTNEDLADFGNVLVDLDLTKPKVITVEDLKSERSLAQNALLWKWYSEMVEHIFDNTGQRYNKEAVHIEMKESFLDPKVYKLRNKIVKKYSTKNIGTKEFAQYLEKIDFYCTDRLNLVLTHPDDIYNEAMGRRAT